MKVLIVDDDAIQRMLLVDLLQRFDQVEIVEAADGDSAWEELQRGLFPVLCCCDMRMPGISGTELLQRFKSRAALADVPFVFITAATDSITIKEAIASGATNYILKPFNITKARAGLEKLFGGIRDRYSEEPLTTQKRLGIPPEKLLGYYAALKQQLALAGPPLHEQLTGGETSAVRARLDSLKTGCVALGLWHAAAVIEHVRALEPDLVGRVLTDVEACVDEQVVHARMEFGIREPRKPRANETPVQGNSGQVAAAA